MQYLIFNNWLTSLQLNNNSQKLSKGIIWFRDLTKWQKKLAIHLSDFFPTKKSQRDMDQSVETLSWSVWQHYLIWEHIAEVTISNQIVATENYCYWSFNQKNIEQKDQSVKKLFDHMIIISYQKTYKNSLHKQANTNKKLLTIHGKLTFISFWPLYHSSFKKFLPVDCIVAGLSSLLVVFLLLVYWYSGWYGVPYFRRRPRVCVFSPQHDDTHGTWLMTKINDIW